MEIKFIFFGLIFYLVLGFGIEIFVNEDVSESEIDLSDEFEALDENFLASASYSFTTTLFSVFGVDLGNELLILPDMVNSFLTLIGTLLIVVFAMWVFQNVGQIIPFT